MRREWIPNLITLSSLGMGFASLLFTLEAGFQLSALAILVAGVFDALDGRVARLLRVHSPIGAELDSLADLVSFGVAPGFLMYAWDLRDLGVFGALPAALYVASAAYRLARFNLGTPAGYFVGLPSAAAGGLVASFVLYDSRPHALFCLVLALVLATLMISRLSYRDFKRIDLSEVRFSKLFLGVAIASVIALINPRKLLFLPFAVYLVYGPKESLMKIHNKRGNTNEQPEVPGRGNGHLGTALQRGPSSDDPWHPDELPG